MKHKLAYGMAMCIAIGFGMILRGPADDGQHVPEVSLPTLTDPPGSVAIADLSKPAVIVFWASWCPYCDPLHVLLDAVSARYGGLVASVGVISWDTPEAALSKVEESENDHVFHLVDRLGDVARDLGIPGVPAAIVVDEHGLIRYGCVGCEGNAVEIFATLDSLVGNRVTNH